MAKLGRDGADDLADEHMVVLSKRLAIQVCDLGLSIAVLRNAR